MTGLQFRSRIGLQKTNPRSIAYPFAENRDPIAAPGLLGNSDSLSILKKLVGEISCVWLAIQGGKLGKKFYFGRLLGLR